MSAPSLLQSVCCLSSPLWCVPVCADPHTRVSDVVAQRFARDVQEGHVLHGSVQIGGQVAARAEEGTAAHHCTVKHTQSVHKSNECQPDA